MPEAKTRARFIAAANALASVGHGRFTLKELYAEAGLTKKEFNSVFGTKAALINAAWETNTSAVTAVKPARKVESQNIDNKWIERRFRILERAISSLETQILDLRKKPKKDTLPATAPTIPEPSVTNPIQAQTPVSSYEQRAHTGQREHEPESQDLITGTNYSLEPPPYVTECKDVDVTDTNKAMRPPPFISETEDIDVGDINSYWQIATEQIKVHPHKTLVVLLFAIIVGVLFGIVTSTIHAGAEIPKPQINNDRTSSKNIGLSSLRVLTDRAVAGDLAAQSELAFKYARGDGVEPDFPNAMRWAEPAASDGNADAQYLLGWVLQEGVKPNLARAAHLYAEAANGGNVMAMHNFAIALLTGSGVKKDSVMASHWFERAANLGYRDSEFDLALLYERGEGVAQNPLLALRWYEKAASSGDAEAAQRAKLLRENVPVPTTGP